MKQKKKKTKTWHVQNKNLTKFYYKEETKTKSSYDKKTYSKLMLNRLKVMKTFTFIYTHWAPSSKNFQSTCGPCLPVCTHMWIMNELKLNLEWIKIQLIMNLNLIKSELKVNWNKLKLNQGLTRSALWITRSELKLNQELTRSELWITRSELKLNQRLTKNELRLN
jgi:hypothetical protein